MTTEIIILLIAFQIKHFLCDYPLQTQYMLQKCKREGYNLCKLKKLVKIK